MALIEDYGLGQDIKVKAGGHVQRQKMLYERLLKRIWQNDDYTPQQVFDAVGTDGVKFVAYITAIRDFVLAVKPAETLTNPNATYGTITENPDGTVTVDTIL